MSRQGVKKEKRLKRLFGVSTIILSLLIAFIPNFVYAASASGTDWGIKWELSGDTLTISPAETPSGNHASGEMDDAWPLSSLSSTFSGVKKVVVNSGVKKLGTAFCNMLSKLNNLSITLNAPAIILSNSISYSSINTLEFGEGVTSIEDHAVTPANATSNINRLVLPASLTSFNYDNFCYNDGTDDHYNIGEIVTPSASQGEEFLKDINKYVINGEAVSGTTYKNSNGIISLFHKDTSGTPRKEGRTYIKDLRSAATKTNYDVISASTYDSENNDYYLEVKDVADSTLKGKIPSEVNNYTLYDLTLKNKSGATVQQTCSITLPVPQTWDVVSKDLKVYSLKGSSLDTIEAKGVEVDGRKCLTFSTEHFSEFALTDYEGSGSGGGGTDPTSTATTDTPTTTTPTTDTPTTTNPTTPTVTPTSTGGKKSSSSTEKTYTITVKDERTEKSDSRYISAKVSNLEQNLVLVVKDSDGAEIQKSLVVPNKGIVKYVDLDLQNDKGEGVVGYGTCTVVLPIPQEMDLTKGSVKVMAFDANNTLKEISSKIVEVSGKKCVKFNPPHFSEFALVYTPFSGNTTNGNGNGGNNGNNSATGNKVIMPKTGGGDEIRYILSAFLFLFGTVQLITSVTKKVKTA